MYQKWEMMVCSRIEFVCRRPSPRVGGGDGGDWREREVNQSYDGIASYDSDDDSDDDRVMMMIMMTVIRMTVIMMTVVMIMTVMMMTVMMMTVMSDDDSGDDNDLKKRLPLPL